MLTIEKLTLRQHGHTVLEDLDIFVAPREIVALVGPAGAGKTAALDCIVGRRRPAAGRITVAGVDVTRAPDEAGAHLACVPADLDLPATRRALDHTREHCERLGRRIPDSVLRATLERNGVSARFHAERIGDCPPAVQRHLALSLAWLRNAPALLIDEPTRDLDPKDVDTVVVNLRCLRKGDRAILLATRDLAFARRIATRIVLLERGAVVETFDPHASHQAHARTSYLAELVA